jgi:hypothetical protein
MYKSGRCRKASIPVFGALLMIIIIFIVGYMFFSFVMTKVDFAKGTFSAQMSRLLLQSFSINSTHVTAWLQNVGNTFITITGAYVNGAIAALTNAVQIEAGSVQTASLLGVFTEGCTYCVKLLSSCNTVISFDIAY